MLDAGFQAEHLAPLEGFAESEEDYPADSDTGPDTEPGGSARDESQRAHDL